MISVWEDRDTIPPGTIFYPYKATLFSLWSKKLEFFFRIRSSDPAPSAKNPNLRSLPLGVLSDSERSSVCHSVSRSTNRDDYFKGYVVWQVVIEGSMFPANCCNLLPSPALLWFLRGFTSRREQHSTTTGRLRGRFWISLANFICNGESKQLKIVYCLMTRLNILSMCLWIF